VHERERRRERQRKTDRERERERERENDLACLSVDKAPPAEYGRPLVTTLHLCSWYKETQFFFEAFRVAND
jgi:hypothetical protein